MEIAYKPILVSTNAIYKQLVNTIQQGELYEKLKVGLPISVLVQEYALRIECDDLNVVLEYFDKDSASITVYYHIAMRLLDINKADTLMLCLIIKGDIYHYLRQMLGVTRLRGEVGSDFIKFENTYDDLRNVGWIIEP